MEQSHLEILLEEMRSRFDLVLEGYTALDCKIDDRFDRVNERLDHHAFLIETLNRKIDGVDSRLDTKVDSLEARLDAKIDSLEARLDAKIDSLEARLDAKIDGVEARLATKIDGIAADLSAHRADTEAHHGSSWQVRE